MNLSRQSTSLLLLCLTISLSLRPFDVNAQEQDLVLVSSVSLAMTISPTGDELLPESLRIIQQTMNSALQVAQEENTGNATGNYLIHRTKVVFRNADFHPDNATTTVRFFALATALTVSVPAGTSFRDYRLRSAASRQAELDELVFSVFNSTVVVDGLPGSLEAAGLDSVVASDQVLAIEYIYVYHAADTTTPPSLDVENLPSTNGLSSIDISLIGSSVLVLFLVIFASFYYQRKSEDCVDEPARSSDGLMVDTMAPTRQEEDMNHKESYGGRLPLYRDSGEFKTGDSASSSIASIVFQDFHPPPKLRLLLPDCQVFGSDLESILQKKPSLRSDVEKSPAACEEGDNVDSTHHDVGVNDSNDGVSSNTPTVSDALAIGAEEDSDNPASPILAVADESSHFSKTLMNKDEAKRLVSNGAHPDSFSPLLNVDELVPSSFSVLVDTLLMSDPQGLLFSSEAKDALNGDDELSAAETFSIKVFHDDISSTTSMGGNVFRELSRSVSNGSEDVFKVDVESASKEAERAAISDWMKSVCVVRSNSASTDSKTSINTSFSSVTTPSSAEQVDSAVGPKRKRHRYIESQVPEDDAELVEV